MSNESGGKIVKITRTVGGKISIAYNRTNGCENASWLALHIDDSLFNSESPFQLDGVDSRNMYNEQIQLTYKDNLSFNRSGY